MEARGNGGLGNNMQPAVPLVIPALLVAHVVSNSAPEVVHRWDGGVALGVPTPVVEVSIG